MPGTKVASEGYYLATKQHSWSQLRAPAEEDSSALLAATAFPLDAYDLDARSGAVDLFDLFGNTFTSLVMCFVSDKLDSDEPANNETFGYTVLGWPSGAGVGNPPHWICQSTTNTACVVGLMTTVVLPDGTAPTSSADARFADTLTLSDNWMGVCDVSDAAGADRMALLRIRDLLGLRHIEVLTHGTSSPAIGVYGRAY